MATKTSKTVKPRSRNLRGEGDRLRLEIIDAAIRLLSRLAPEEPFSLRAVAKEAGVAAPSVYIHFDDRNILLLAVLEELFKEQIAVRDAADAEAGSRGGTAWDRLLARSLAGVRLGLQRPGHYKVLFEGRVVPQLDDPRAATFGRPLLQRSVELIRQITVKTSVARTSNDPERLALLLWSGLHGIVSLRINKPTLDWPDADELAEQIAHAIIQPGRISTKANQVVA
jgi:AcrR family transcriptional regulator